MSYKIVFSSCTKNIKQVKERFCKRKIINYRKRICFFHLKVHKTALGEGEIPFAGIFVEKKQMGTFSCH